MSRLLRLFSLSLASLMLVGVWALEAHTLSVVNLAEPLSRKDLEATILENRLGPVGFYFVLGDLYGSHKITPGLSASEALTQFEDRLLEMQRVALYDDRRDITELLQRKSGSEFLEDEELMEKARQLIYRLDADTEILKLIEADSPLVYAIVLKGEAINAAPPRIIGISQLTLRGNKIGGLELKQRRRDDLVEGWKRSFDQNRSQTSLHLYSRLLSAELPQPPPME